MTHETDADENVRTDRDAPHDKKPDAHVLGRGETHVPEDDAVILTDGGTESRAVCERCGSVSPEGEVAPPAQCSEGNSRDEEHLWESRPVVTDGGRDLPRFVYDDAAISTGDIVVDLSSGKALQVVGKSVQTVGEHPQTRSDDTAAMFGAHSAETVFDCVFLPDGEKVTPPTKTYAYPESRLLRYPVEDATDYDGNIQTWLRTAFLDELAEAAADNDRLKAAVSSAVREAYGDDLRATFRELVETKSDEPEVATDGGTVQTGPEARPDTETSKLRRPFHITASGPATAVRETNTGLVERDDVTVEIDRETRDPADLVFFVKQYNRQNWKDDAVMHLLDGESFPSYRVEDYDEWTVTFDGPVQSWFALARQMLDGEFEGPKETGRPSHVANTKMRLVREDTRSDEAYWVATLTEPLVKSTADLYGHGAALAYAAGNHAIDDASVLDSAVRSQVDLLADDMEGDR